MTFWFLRQSKEMLRMCPPLLGLFPYTALVKAHTEHSRFVPTSFPLHRCKYRHSGHSLIKFTMWVCH